MDAENIFDAIPREIDDELFTTLLGDSKVKIERIVSRGHASPAEGWYDQAANEWVIVLRGEAVIVLGNDVPGNDVLENKSEVRLRAGSYLHIPAHTRHRVAWTKPGDDTVWLAVHY